MMQNRTLPLLALLAANAISMSGNAMATIAIPWFVLETTGSITDTALSGAAGAIPIVLAAIIGGVWVDRVGHRRASIYSDIASGVTIALIPILYLLGWLSFPFLLVLVFFGALLDAPGVAARGALVPDLANLAGWRLEMVNSIHEVIESGSGLVGPLLAGVLIAALSAGNVLLVDALTFGLSALVVALLIPRVIGRGTQDAENSDRRETGNEKRENTTETHPLTPSEAGGTAGPVLSLAQMEGGTVAEVAVEEEEPLSFRFLLSAFRQGVAYVWADGPLRAIFGSAVLLNFLLSPVFGLLLPVYMREVAQSSVGLGAVIAAFGGGSVLGAIVYGAWGHRWSRRATFLVGVVAIGLGVVGVGLLLPIPFMVASFFTAGLIAGPNGPLINTITQERTPAAMRGRVLSIVNAMCFAGGPAGFVVAGLLLPLIGIQATLLAAGGLFALTGIVLALDPGLKAVDS